MAIEYKDYYEILGIDREAGDEEIRRAFRKLARTFHPDKTGNNAEAESRFKEINEAYEVLGDPDRRRRYDEFHHSWQTSPSADEAWRNFAGARVPGAAGRAEHFTFSGAGFSEFFDQLFAEEPGPSTGRPREEEPSLRSRREVEEQTDGRGDDLESDIRVSLEDVANGATRSITMKRLVRCRKCFGLGQYNAHPCEECSGRGSTLQNDTFAVKIPRGIREGAFLRVPRRGEEGANGAPPGDLYLKVCYAGHPDFQIENGQVVYDLEVAPWEAVLGSSVNIPTPAGSATIRIPAGTQNGSKLRLRGRGLPTAEGDFADLFVRVKVQVPKSASENERPLWEQLARECQFSPRDN